MTGRGGEEDTAGRGPVRGQDSREESKIVCPECGQRLDYPEGPLFYYRCPYCGYDYGCEYEVH